MAGQSHPLRKMSLHMDTTTPMLAYNMHVQVTARYAASSAPREGRAMGTSSHKTQRKPLETRHVQVV